MVYGKLKPETSIEEAQAEMDGLAAQVAREFPETNEHIAVRVADMQDIRTRAIRATLRMMLVAVAFFLLLACANVANLLLARGAARQKEIAIRLALGASSWRVAQGVVCECIVLALPGTLVGIACAYGGVHWLQTLLSPSLPLYTVITLNMRSLVIAVVVSVVSALFFGVIPAIVASRTSPSGCLKAVGAATTHGQSAVLIRNGLVALTIAVSITLVVCSGLLVRSIYFLTTHDRGLDPDGVATIRIQLSRGKYPDGPSIREYYRRAIERLSDVPGVDSVGVVSFLPVHSMFVGSEIDLEGRHMDEEAGSIFSAYKIIAPNYHEMLQIPLLSGRLFNDLDTPDSLPVAIISQQTAASLWPDESPIGKRIRLKLPNVEYPWNALDRAEWRTIVGVVGHVSKYGIADVPDAEPINEIYIPLSQQQGRLMHVLVRAPSDTIRVGSTARMALRDVDPDQPVGSVELLPDLISDEFAQHRNILTLLSVFSMASVVLAAVGIFGVMSHWVTQQRREISIRIALGAATSRILAFVLMRGLWISLAGTVSGVFAARVTSRLLSSQLYGVALNDPVTYVLVVSFVFFLAILSCLAPAHMAARTPAWDVLKDDG